MSVGLFVSNNYVKKFCATFLRIVPAEHFDVSKTWKSHEKKMREPFLLFCCDVYDSANIKCHRATWIIRRWVHYKCINVGKIGSGV